MLIGFVSRGLKIRIFQDEMIRLRGYPAEVHRVTTMDGYILTMYRITGPRGSQKTGKYNYGNKTRESSNPKKVVLVQHCVHCSSFEFLLNDPNQALGK